jgi:hypothetical protein
MKKIIISNPLNLVGVIFCTLFLLGSCAVASSNEDNKALPSCWPICNQIPGPLAFGVAPATFTMGNYLGVKPTSYPSQAQINQQLRFLKGSNSLFLHFYVSYASGITSQMISQLKAFSKEGFFINLVLRYIPKNPKVPDPKGFANWVKGVVKGLSFVKVFQITNETNASATPDSDGYYKGSMHALILGMLEASSVKKPYQMIGFNWSYNPDVSQDTAFFDRLKALGGVAFSKAVNFFGLDMYPDTYFPTPNPDANFATEDSLILSLVRNELMPILGWGKKVPIFIQEISWPTINPNVAKSYSASNFAQSFMSNYFGKDLFKRSPSDQAEFLSQAIKVSRLYGVALLEWFGLTDAKTPLGDGWGLFYSNGKPKPAAYVLKNAF